MVTISTSPSGAVVVEDASSSSSDSDDDGAMPCCAAPPKPPVLSACTALIVSPLAVLESVLTKDTHIGAATSGGISSAHHAAQGFFRRQLELQALEDMKTSSRLFQRLDAAWALSQRQGDPTMDAEDDDGVSVGDGDDDAVIWEAAAAATPSPPPFVTLSTEQMMD